LYYLWSRQYDIEGNLFYQVGEPQPINHLPAWVLSVCKEDPHQTNSDRDHRLTYQLPPALDRPPPDGTTPPLYQLEHSLLPPSSRWCVAQQRSDLFPITESTAQRPSYPYL
jgi:hypothetical protein